MQIIDKLLEPYTISSDKQGGFVILEEVVRNNRKTGVIAAAQKPVGYTVSIKSAVQLIVRKKLANKEAVYTLKQFINEYKTLEQEISETLSIS